jgi:hypothetical protein
MEDEYIEDLEEEELVVFGSTTNSALTPEKTLLISMVVLALQDLNLEKYFQGLRKYFIVAKKEKLDSDNIMSALNYIFNKKYEDYMLSFSNFCFVFNINEDLFRELIKSYIKKHGGAVYMHYIEWSDTHEI